MAFQSATYVARRADSATGPANSPCLHHRGVSSCTWNYVPTDNIFTQFASRRICLNTELDIAGVIGGHGITITNQD